MTTKLTTYVVTAMHNLSGSQDIVKIQAETPKEAEKIYQDYMVVFAVEESDWYKVQDAIIDESDGDFKEFLIKSKDAVKNGTCHNG